MKQKMAITPKFVEFIPASTDLKEGIIYVSMIYAVATHRCCCGCGEEVVTPFSPTDWKLIFDGETISLNRSIGNWSFDCQSHYWIKHNKIEWAGRWSQEEINAGRTLDQSSKDEYFESVSVAPSDVITDNSGTSASSIAKSGFWKKLKIIFSRWKG